MRCPVCSMYTCICAPGVQHAEIRRSFNAFAYWKRRERETPTEEGVADPASMDGEVIHAAGVRTTEPNPPLHKDGKP